MKAGGGKRKGSSFEREVCAMLSLFVTKGVRRDVFWRSSMSGGRSTVARKRRPSLKRGKQDLAHVAGDICAVHPEGTAFVDRYFVECKHYRDMQVGHAVMNGSGRLVSFFEVAFKNAWELHKDPLLIFKQDRSPIMVASTMFGFDSLNWSAATAINYGSNKNCALSGFQATAIMDSVIYVDLAEVVFDPKRSLAGAT